MVKKVNTKSNELTKKTRKVIKKNNIPKEDVKKVKRKTTVKGGSKESRNFATEFNNLVNLYYLLEMVLKINKYNVIVSGRIPPNFHKIDKIDKIDIVSNILKKYIILDPIYKFARKKQSQLGIFADSIKENLTIRKFGRIHDSGDIDIDAFLNIRIRKIEEKIIKHINMGNAYLFNYTRSSNIFRKNLKSDKVADENRTEEDFLTDLILGDIHFYLRNTATGKSDFVNNTNIFGSESSLKSINFNKITDDKIKIFLFYRMLKYTFDVNNHVNNLSKLIICPTELNFFMYNDNKSLTLNQGTYHSQIFNTDCNNILKNVSNIIQNYIKEKMPIINSINNVKDYEVKILYDKYLKYIEDYSNNVFCISSFFKFIGYEFSKLPMKDKNEDHINRALDRIFHNFIETHLSGIDIVSSPNKELSFSELLRNLNNLHNKIFLLDKLHDSDYIKLPRHNPLNYIQRNLDKQDFVYNYRKFFMGCFNIFYNEEKCKQDIQDGLEKELKEYIMKDDNHKYQKVLLRSSVKDDIRKIKTHEDHKRYFEDLENELNKLMNFTKIKKTGMFRNSSKDKDEFYKLYQITKKALEEVKKCKNFYKIIIEIDLYSQADSSIQQNQNNPQQPQPQQDLTSSHSQSSTSDETLTIEQKLDIIKKYDLELYNYANNIVYNILYDNPTANNEACVETSKLISNEIIVNLNQQLNSNQDRDIILEQFKIFDILYNLLKDRKCPQGDSSVYSSGDSSGDSLNIFNTYEKKEIERLISALKKKFNITGGKGKKKKLTEKEKAKAKKEKDKAKEKAKKEKAKKEKEKEKEKAKKEKEKAKEKAKKEKAKEKAKKVTKKK